MGHNSIKILPIYLGYSLGYFHNANPCPTRSEPGNEDANNKFGSTGYLTRLVSPLCNIKAVFNGLSL